MNSDDARFCSGCGAALAESERMREQRKIVTVLFCDLVGSTALGESTDPEALRTRMRRYFDDLRMIVERHGGAVEKFVGDAVMAVFGIPVSHEDDALRAVRAAAEMGVAVREHELDARIGINTGEVVVGGEGETLVTGDAVNVAARLEQAAAPGEALIGAETRLLVRDAVRVEAVEPLSLKGKREPVEAFRLLEVLGAAEALARHPDAPLVGRERERERLWRDFEDAVTERTCRLVTLLGPAGIGKSRLVAEFLERAGGEADILRGRCLPYGEGITYWPLVEILVGIGVDPDSIIASSPEETRVTFRRLLEARALERAQVVVVDDLQWAESTLIDLVEHVADFSRDAPILLLCVARTELLERRPGWGGGKLNSTSVLLGPLGEAQCGELIAHRLGSSPLDEATRERIVAASEGNPLYVEEMLAMVRERGLPEDVVVPPTIHALLQARLDLLDGDERVVIEHAAVEGQVFHRGSLGALASERLSTELDLHLSSLVRMELIRPERSLLPGEEAFCFRHLLIRDAAYAGMPKELRAELHERFAEWLEHAAAGSTFDLDELLGYHLEQAYRLLEELGRVGEAERELAARAAARLLAAGRASLGRAHVAAAAGLLQRGTDLLAAEDPRRLEALPELGLALVRRGEFERAEGLLRQAIDGARAIGDERTDSRARLALNSLRTRNDPEASVETSSPRPSRSPRRWNASATSRPWPSVPRIGMCRFQLGRAGEGETDLERAAELARLAEDSAAEHASLNARLRPIALGPTHAVRGCRILRHASRAPSNERGDRAHALQVRALFAAMRGDSSEPYLQLGGRGVDRGVRPHAARASTRWTSDSRRRSPVTSTAAERELRGARPARRDRRHRRSEHAGRPARPTSASAAATTTPATRRREPRDRGGRRSRRTAALARRSRAGPRAPRRARAGAQRLRARQSRSSSRSTSSAEGGRLRRARRGARTSAGESTRRLRPSSARSRSTSRRATSSRPRARARVLDELRAARRS